MTRIERSLPLSGALGGLLWAIAAILTVSQPQATDNATKYVHWFADHQTQGLLAAAAASYFCVLMLLFAVAIRRALRPAGLGYAAAGYAGGIGVALAIALTGVVIAAEVDAAHKHNPAAVTTLGYLDGDLWLLLSASLATFFLATGLGALRARVLPRPWAIVTIVLGVLCLLPLGGIAAYFATPVWLITTSTMLYRRQLVATPTPALQPVPSTV